MEDFGGWVRKTQNPCIQQYADRLLELGASWGSFRRDEADVRQDLEKFGIPSLAAHDIYKIVSEQIASSEAPMCIFWDIENVPIPTNVSGRYVASRIKEALAPHGRLEQFRGYASIGLNNIPKGKRSELHLSACHLIDCPHVGRKEVADKMIIVDAMQFAYSNPQGATLCLITGDVDYAYLLAALQKPQWKTIVISKGTVESMLHVNCSLKMQWETDILQLPSLPESSKDTKEAQMKTHTKSREAVKYDGSKPPSGLEKIIIEAIQSLKDRKGSGLPSIQKIMREQLVEDAKMPYARKIRVALKRAVAKGILIKVRDRYQISPEFQKHHAAASKPEEVKKVPVNPKKNEGEQINRSKEPLPMYGNITHEASNNNTSDNDPTTTTNKEIDAGKKAQTDILQLLSLAVSPHDYAEEVRIKNPPDGLETIECDGPKPPFGLQIGIIEAIQSLRDHRGSSLTSIQKLMREQLPEGAKFPRNSRFRVALERLVAEGILINDQDRYMVSVEYQRQQHIDSAVMKVPLNPGIKEGEQMNGSNKEPHSNDSMATHEASNINHSANSSTDTIANKELLLSMDGDTTYELSNNNPSENHNPAATTETTNGGTNLEKKPTKKKKKKPTPKKKPATKEKKTKKLR